MNAVNLLIVGEGGEFLTRRWSGLEEPDLVVTVATTASAALEVCGRSPDRPRVVVFCETPPNVLPDGWCGCVRALAVAPLLVIRLRLGWPPHAEDAPADEADFSLRGVGTDETWLVAVDAVVRLAARNVADRRCESPRAGPDRHSGQDLDRLTPERRREAVVREQQERLRSAVEAAELVTWWFDVDNACYIGDAALIRLLGLLPADSSTVDLGTYLNCVYPADRELVDQAWHAMLREGGTLDLEYRVFASDGRVRWVRDRGRLLTATTGRSSYAAGALLDITERQQMKQELKSKEERFQRIVMTANEGIWEVDAEFMTSFVNPRLAGMLGYSIDEMTGMPEVNLICAEDLPDYLAQTEIRRRGIDSQYQRRLRRKDGSSCLTWVTTTALLDETGRFIGSFGTFADISELKRLEEALRCREREFANLVENSPDLIFRLDRNGQAVYVNSSGLCAGALTDDAAWGHGETKPDVVSRLCAFEAEAIREVFDEAEERELEVHFGYRCLRLRLVPELCDGGSVETVLGIAEDVTAKCAAEYALRRTEALLAAGMRIAGLGIAEWDIRQGLFHVSDEWRQMHGVLADRLTPVEIESLIHADDRASVREAMRSNGDGGEANELEYRIVRPDDGTVRLIRVTGSLLKDEWGDSVRAFGIAMDVTEQRQREEDIRTQAYILDNIAQGVNYVDETGLINYTNPAFDAMFGYQRGELIGRSAAVLIDVMPGEGQRRLHLIIERLRQQGGCAGEFLSRRKDGTPFPAQVTITRLPIHGQMCAVSVVEDITARVRALEALRESEQRLATVLEKTNTGLWDFSPCSGQTYFSPTWYTMLGYAPDELPAALETWEALIHPDDICPAREEFLRAIESGESSSPYQIRIRMLTRQGGWRWIDTRGVAVSRGADGRALRMVGTHTDVTDRVEADQALRDSEERLRLALTAAQMDVFDFEPGADRVRRTVNRGAWRWLPSEGSGKGYLALVHPEDRKAFLAVMRTLSPEQPAYTVEYRARDHEGNYRWIADWAEARFDDSGLLSRIVGVAADIDERKKTEIQLRELNERMSLAVSISGLGFYQLSLRSGEVEANPEYLTQLGYQPGETELTASLFESWLHPDDRASLKRRFERHIAGLTTYFEAEYRVRHKHGDWVWIVERSRVVSHDADGTPERVVGVHLDITAQKRSEEVLREKDERFRLWSDATDSLFWVAGANGVFSGPRGALETVSGRAWKAVQGWPWVESVHPDDREELSRCWERARATQGLFECESRIWHAASREYRWYLDRGIPRSGGNGEVLEWVGMSVDIQRQKEAEAALQEADRRKDEFLAMLGHELRNPLASIRTAGELLGRVTPSSSDVVARVQDVILRQSDHLVRLVDDLLDVARLLQGKIRLQREVVGIGNVMHQVADSIRPICRIRCQQLTVSDPDGPCFVHGDPVRMTQIIENLLTNASKYTHDGGSIRLEAEAVGDDVELRVIDDGIGIRAGLLSGIFSLFTQDERNLDRSPGGLGIGLTVVKQLVELHGGLISARSDGEGKGSEFAVRLPLFRGEIPAMDQQRPDTGDRLSPGSSRVMIVDDNQDALMTLASLLEMHGHQVATALDGQTALDLAQHFRPEVVLLDIGLPGMDGYEVARRLRISDVTRTSQIIAVTGYGQQRYRQEAQQAGFDVFLAKPIRFEQILQAMETATHGN